MAFTKCEWNEDVWKGAAAGCSVFVGLFNVVAAEDGEEKAFGMLNKLGTAIGTHTGEMFKQQLGDQKLDVKKLSEFIVAFNTPFGCQMEIEQETDSFRIRHHNCPLAAAYKTMGVDHETGKRICEDWGVAVFENLMKLLAPNGKYELAHYREDWDDICEERYWPGE